jgi:hypothetical protein
MSQDQSTQSTPQTCFTPCHECKKAIVQSNEDGFRGGEVGDFFRLRCGDPACGHVDWYHHTEFDFEITTTSVRQPVSNAGQVFVHDILLELTISEPAETR